MAFVGGMAGDMRVRIVIEAINATQAGLNAAVKDVEKAASRYQKAYKVTSAEPVYRKQLEKTAKQLRNKVALNKQIATSLNEARIQQEAMSASTKGFLGVLTMNFETWRRANEIGMFSGKAVSARTKFANWLRMATHGMKGFRMEYLSLMFAGMSLHRTMSNLLQPASRALGLTELWSNTLMIFFLPVMQQVQGISLWWMDFLMNMPDWFKWAVGWVVVLGNALGSLFAFIGQACLAFGGFLIFMSSSTMATIRNTLATKLNALTKRSLTSNTNICMAATMGLSSALASQIGIMDLSTISTNALAASQANLAAVSGLAGAGITGVGGAAAAGGMGLAGLASSVLFVVTAILMAFVAIRSFSAYLRETAPKDYAIAASAIRKTIPFALENIAKTVPFLFPITTLYEIFGEKIVPEETKENLVDTIMTLFGFEDAADVASNSINTFTLTVEDNLPDVENTFSRVKRTVEESTSAIGMLESKLTGLDGKTFRSTYTIDVKIAGEQVFVGGLGYSVAPEFRKEFVESVTSSLNEQINTAMKKEKGLEITPYGIRPEGWTLQTEFESVLAKSWPEAFGDVVWRPGARPVRISPSDTIIASKSGTGNVINFNPNVNIEINASSEVDIDAIKDKLSEEWIRELKSMVG